MVFISPHLCTVLTSAVGCADARASTDPGFGGGGAFAFMPVGCFTIGAPTCGMSTKGALANGAAL